MAQDGSLHLCEKIGLYVRWHVDQLYFHRKIHFLDHMNILLTPHVIVSHSVVSEG